VTRDAACCQIAYDMDSEGLKQGNRNPTIKHDKLTPAYHPFAVMQPNRVIALPLVTERPVKMENASPVIVGGSADFVPQ